ncbi:MAG: VWA domain-containing protein [Verrucomicrobiota bacterium]
MNFASPQFFWLFLFLVAPLCVLLFLAWRTKQKLIAQFVQSRLLANLTVGVSQTRQKIRLILLVAAVVFLVIAMARPQWGFSLEESRQQGLDIVVAIDTSRSMLAADLAPNRLTRAKLAALDLMRLSKNDRLGLVAFAGSAFLQCPLTLDEEAFRQSVETLDVGIIPQGGTAITEAIQTALTAFGKSSDNHKVLVLFSDGEENENNQSAISTAESAAKKGLRIFTMGVGTAEGELIRVPDEQGKLSFLKDDAGNAVKSRLDETLLRKIAVNGFYLPLQGAKPMEVLYARGLAPLPKSDSTTKLIRQARERFHWPLGVAIALLVLETFLPHRRRILPARNAKIAGDQIPSAAAGVVLICLFCGSSAIGSPSQALQEYKGGNFHTALEEFKKLSREKTNDLRLSYNAGTAAYKAKQFEEAQRFFNEATAAPDLKLQQRSFYNLGNTLFEAGEQAQEPDHKQKAWESAAQSFQNSLKLDAQDADAKHNLEFVKKKLEELKKQQQEKKDQPKDQKQDQNKQDKDKKDSSENKENKKAGEQKSDDAKDQKKDPSKPQDESQKKDPSEQEEKKSDGEKKSQEEKNKNAQQKKDQPQQGEEPKPGDEKKQQEAAALAAGQMTPEQARQFLDMQKQEDRALIFAPEKKPLTGARKLKDW